jgi:hypothetical protein
VVGAGQVKLSTQRCRGRREREKGRREMTPEKQGSSSESVFLSGSPLSQVSPLKINVHRRTSVTPDPEKVKEDVAKSPVP